MDKLTIAIIGLGLIGGSIGLELASWSRKKVIRGYDVREEVLSAAQKKGAINVALDFEETVQGADLIFIATPVRTIPKVFARMRPFLSPGSLILDLGSVKEWVFEEIKRDTLPWEYVGFHPMGGKEKGGIERAEKGLFRGMPVLVSPPSLRETTRDLIVEVAGIIGGRVFF
ncbi:MAG: prephenate dehydrogenase/arogenate dehydrogenase family protein [Candidatus Caldatribacteriaceae bacterium]